MTRNRAIKGIDPRRRAQDGFGVLIREHRSAAKEVVSGPSVREQQRSLELVPLVADDQSDRLPDHDGTSVGVKRKS